LQAFALLHKKLLLVVSLIKINKTMYYTVYLLWQVHGSIFLQILAQFLSLYYDRPSLVVSELLKARKKIDALFE